MVISTRSMRFALTLLVFLFTAGCTLYRLEASTIKADQLAEGMTQQYSDYSEASKKANEQLPSREEVARYFRKLAPNGTDLSFTATAVSADFPFIHLIPNVEEIANLAATLYNSEKLQMSTEWQLMERLMAPFHVYCKTPKKQCGSLYRRTGATVHSFYYVTEQFKENWDELVSIVRSGLKPSVRLLTEILVHLLTHRIYTAAGPPDRFLDYMQKTVHLKHGVPEGSTPFHLAMAHELSMFSEAEIFYLVSAPCATFAECQARLWLIRNSTKDRSMNVYSGDGEAFVNAIHYSRFDHAFTSEHIRFGTHMAHLEELLMVPNGKFVSIKSFQFAPELDPFLPRTGPLSKPDDSDYIWRLAKRAGHRYDKNGFVQLLAPAKDVPLLPWTPVTYMPVDVIRFELPVNDAKAIRIKLAKTLIRALIRQCRYLPQTKLILMKELKLNVLYQLKKGNAPYDGDLASILSAIYHYLFNAVFSMHEISQRSYADRCTTNAKLELEHSLKVGILLRNDHLIKSVVTSNSTWLQGDNLPIPITIPEKYFKPNVSKPAIQLSNHLKVAMKIANDIAVSN